jgi:hypothetical protein
VEHPVDQVELARRVLWVRAPGLDRLVEAEQADHAVDVDGEDRAVGLRFAEKHHREVRSNGFAIRPRRGCTASP